MLYMELDIEVLKLLIVKLSVVIGDNDLREAELADDQFPHELFSLSFSDLGHRLGFHPLGKVINSDEKEFALPFCRGKRT